MKQGYKDLYSSEVKIDTETISVARIAEGGKMLTDHLQLHMAPQDYSAVFAFRFLLVWKTPPRPK